MNARRITNDRAAPILIARNMGGRTFATSATMNMPAGTQGRGVALGHFDGNGALDIVTGTSVQNDYGATFVFLNDGSGTFGPAIQSTAVPGLDPLPWTVWLRRHQLDGLA